VLTTSVAAGFAQGWEFGGYGGAGFLNSVSASGGPSSATAGFQPGVAAGAYVGGFSQYKHIGGELHYEFLRSNLRLKSGGQETTFNGNSHSIHYDVIFKTDKNSGKVQVFGAAGVGLKIFRGTGTESAYQPLYQYGYLTKTQQLKPMWTIGAGAKFALTRKVFLRTEIRDFMTTFPKDVIAPPPGVKYGTLLHDIVPMVGIGVEM
jgi:opacity protein-like surface antigen